MKLKLLLFAFTVSIGFVNAQSFDMDAYLDSLASKISTGAIDDVPPTTIPPTYDCDFFDLNNFTVDPCPITPGSLDFSGLKASQAFITYNNFVTNGTSFNGKTIRIDDVFIIDTDIQFFECVIEMGPCANIVFQEGLLNVTELEIQRSFISSCSNVMWDAIVAYNHLHKVSISATEIEDGFFAISGYACANFNLSSNDFKSNHIDVFAGDCPISNRMFTDANDFEKTATLYPYQTALEHGACIQMTTMKEEAITGNEMKNYDFPIQVTATNLTLQNNTIEHDTNEGEAAVIFFCPDNTQSLSCSGNFYKGYEYGITNMLRNNLNPTQSPAYTFFEIDDDAFENIFETSVEMVNRVVHNSFVNNSDFTNVGTGILIQNTSVTPPSFPNFSDPGIRITVENNTMHNVTRRGIHLTNIHGSYVYGAPGSTPVIPKIDANIINLANFSGYEQRGIHVENGFRTSVTENVVSSNSTLSPPQYRFVKGISTSDAIQSYVAGNNLLGLGDGIHIIGDNKQSLWKCNIMNYCYRGMNFDDGSEYGDPNVSTIITDQGAPDDPTDNWWFGTSSVSSRVIGSLNLPPTAPLVKWYHRSTPNNYFPGMPLPTISSFNRIGVPDIFEQCNGTLPMAMVGDFEAMVDGSIEYAVLEESFEYKDQDFVYRQMLANDALNGQSLVLDNFFSLMENSGLASSIDIQKDMANDDLAAAIEKNENWITENLHQSNRKTVNTIYLNSVAVGAPISVADRLTLETIALTTPYLSGDAVYSARVLLGIDPTDYGIAYRQAAPASTQNLASIYPNPSSGELSIALAKSSKNICIFHCYDLSGKLLLSKTIPVGIQVAQFDLSALSNGVYFVEIKDNGTPVLQEKLILAN